MTKLTRILLGCVAAGALSASASAADLPMKAAPAPAPVWTWTGFYVGGFGGAGWGTTETTLTSATVAGLGTVNFNFPFAQNSRSGFLGGGQVGYNYQTGWAVLGVEGDIAGLTVKGTTPCVVVLSCTSSSNWLATVSGRVGGIVGDRTLVYVKGGGAWLNNTQSATLPIFLGIGGQQLANTTSTSIGGLLGMGAEYRFTANWSGFLEYDYMEFKKNIAFTIPAIPGTSIGSSVNNKLSIAKVGVNYKF
jgi:outer membrane immunogenic protein